MTRQFTPEAWKKKEQERDVKAQALAEVGKFESQINQRVRVIYLNVGLGKQKTARNFWVSLEHELSLEEIESRVGKAFGDLK